MKKKKKKKKKIKKKKKKKKKDSYPRQFKERSETVKCLGVLVSWLLSNNLF